MQHKTVYYNNRQLSLTFTNLLSLKTKCNFQITVVLIAKYDIQIKCALIAKHTAITYRVVDTDSVLLVCSDCIHQQKTLQSVTNEI